MKFMPLRNRNRFSLTNLMIFVVIIGGIGGYTLWRSFAASSRTEGSDFKKPGAAQVVSNEFLIKIKPAYAPQIPAHPSASNTGIGSINALDKQQGVKSFEQVAKPGANSIKTDDLFRWYKVTTSQPRKLVPTNNSSDYIKLEQVIKRFKSSQEIEAVQANFVLETSLVPNDPYYSSSTFWGTPADMWGLKKINAEQAWDQTTGSSSVIVADIDTGLDSANPDIKDNIWTNTKEIPGNGIDDDNNGFIDDVNGWNFITNTANFMDDNGHGTHTAGTIGATGNNGVGVVGVNWHVKLMPLKFLDASGSGTLDNAVKAMQYAADMGARVSNNSYGGFGAYQMQDDAVKYEHDKGMVTAVAAGNSNTDALQFTPANSDYAVTVAASGANDQKACFSDFGEKIDVAAPGGDSTSCGGTNDYILSTRSSRSGSNFPAIEPTGNYAIARGTSMATPHVAGLAALLLAKNPSLTNEEIRQIMRQSSVDLGTAGQDSAYGYGRINAGQALALASSHPLTPVITTPSSRGTIFGTAYTMLGQVGGPNFASYKIEAGAGRSPTAWTILASSTTQVSSNGSLASIDTTKLADGTYVLRLTATDSSGKVYRYEVYDVVIDNFDVAINSPNQLVKQPGTASVLGIATTKNGLAFSNYKLEWAPASSPTNWSSTGISLANGGTSPVTNGQLGTWDTTALSVNQQYLLRLTVTGANGASSTVTSTVTADRDLVDGWPKQFTSSANCVLCQARVTYADLDGDGIPEIIVTSSSNQLNVYRRDGTNFPGFPVTIGSSNDFIAWQPTVADLNGDGRPEIVISDVDNSDIRCSGCTEINIVRNDGTLYPGWPKPFLFAESETGDVTPAIADLNGDGVPEIITASTFWAGGTETNYSYLHAYRLDGTEINGFPKALPFSQAAIAGGSKLSIADLDGDGKPEIAMTFQHSIYLFDNQGNVLPGWPFTPPAYNGSAINFSSSPAFGDLAGDGKKEVVAIGNVSSTSLIYALHKDGTLLPGWPPAFPANGGYLSDLQSPENSPIIADVNNDGKDDVVVGLNYTSAFDYRGQQLLGTTNIVGAGEAVSASDVNGDGKLDFAAELYNAIQVGDGSSSPIWSRTFQTDSAGSLAFNQPPALADINKNGRYELGIGENIRLGTGPQTLHAYLWELPFTTPARTSWPTFGHDNQTTGNIRGPSFGPASPADTTPPTVSVTSPAAGSTVSGSVTISANATDNVAIGRVDFLVDGTVVNTDTSSPYSFAWNSAGVTNGTHTLTVNAYDTSSNAASASEVVNVSNGDTTPPSTPTGLSASAAAYNRVNLSWSASTDNVGVAGYYIVRGGVTIAQTTGTGTTYSDSSVNASTSYSYQVMAYDAKGNTSSLSSSVSVTTPSVPDTTAPSAPSALSATAVSSSQINLSWSASTDNVGVTSYDIYRNSSKIGSVASTSTSFGDSGLAALTTYTYFVIARDAAGNSSAASNNASATTQSTPPPATTGSIAGTIYSNKGGTIAGASIQISYSGSRHSYSSDASGNYVIVSLPAGSYNPVKYSARGFNGLSLTISVIGGQTTTQNVTLVSRK